MVYDTEGRISSEDFDNLYDGITNLTKGSYRVVDNDKSNFDNIYSEKMSPPAGRIKGLGQWCCN